MRGVNDASERDGGTEHDGVWIWLRHGAVASQWRQRRAESCGDFISCCVTPQVFKCLKLRMAWLAVVALAVGWRHPPTPLWL